MGDLKILIRGMSVRFVIGVIALVMLGGCYRQSDEQIKACLQEAELAFLKVEDYSKYANMSYSTEIHKQINYEQGSFYRDIKEMRDAIQNYLNGKNGGDSKSLPFDFFKECGVRSIESHYNSKIFELEKEQAFADADRANSEIDAAQDAVLEEYRSKAVRHYTTKGAGNVKVDAFVMENGKTTFCTTSIKDSGKAVDCRE